MIEGLSSSEALARLRATGPNEPAPTPRRLGVAAVPGFLTNPLAAIRRVRGLRRAGRRRERDPHHPHGRPRRRPDFVLTHRSQRAAERLREEVAPRATALRDGAWIEVLRRDLVPGDVVRLCAGDRIPADARLVECRDLHVHEAALTGESMPVEKETSSASDRIFLMILIGPISSVYDFLTFGVLLGVFRAGEAVFHTGWFVESLTTQVLVIFVIRTAGNPLASRPSVALAGTTLVVVAVGALLLFTPFAEMLGFVALPTAFFLFVATATLTYLVLVEVVKRRVLRRALGGSADGAL